MKYFFLLLNFFLLPCLFAQQEEFVAYHDYRNMSDVVYHNFRGFRADAVFEGAKVCVHRSKVDEFFNKAFPKIRCRFVLITYGDRGAPGIYLRYLENPKLIAWFGMNPTTTKHKKFYSIPIGLGKKIEESLLEQEETKEHLLYFNMTIEEKHSNKLKEDERNAVYKYFSNKKYVYFAKRKPFEEYISDLKKSFFVLSPRGNGVDCYRTWEAIAAGSIPIVKSSNLDPLFKDLPVVIIKDWKEIDKSFLERKYQEMSNREYNFEKMYLSYWMNKIEEVIGKG